MTMLIPLTQVVLPTQVTEGETRKLPEGASDDAFWAFMASEDGSDTLLTVPEDPELVPSEAEAEIDEEGLLGDDADTQEPEVMATTGTTDKALTPVSMEPEQGAATQAPVAASSAALPTDGPARGKPPIAKGVPATWPIQLPQQAAADKDLPTPVSPPRSNASERARFVDQPPPVWSGTPPGRTLPEQDPRSPGLNIPVTPVGPVRPSNSVETVKAGFSRAIPLEEGELTLPRDGRARAPEVVQAADVAKAMPATVATAVAQPNPLSDMAFKTVRGPLLADAMIERDLALQMPDDQMINPRAVQATSGPIATGVATAAGIPQHVAQQLAKAMIHQAGGITEVALNPPELGRVRLQISMQDMALVMVVQAERPETLDLMRRHIDVLTQEFASIGYDSLQFQFGDRDTGQTDRPDTTGIGVDDPDMASDTSAGPQAAQQAGLPADGGLDLRL